jgi:hypothetical protein
LLLSSAPQYVRPVGKQGGHDAGRGRVPGPAVQSGALRADGLKITDGKRRVESPADWPVEGLLAHAAGESQSGFRVVDVWESEEAFARFGEKLGPVLEELGVEGEPEVYPAHTCVSA